MPAIPEQPTLRRTTLNRTLDSSATPATPYSSFEATLRAKQGKKLMKPSKRFTSTELEEHGAMLTKVYTLKRVADLLCIGLESGTYATFGVDADGYIAPPEVFRWNEDDRHVYRHVQYPCSPGGAALLFCRHDGQHTRYRLDLSALYRGLAVFSMDYPKSFAEFIKENEDALVGDAFIQCALLGEVIYS